MGKEKPTSKNVAYIIPEGEYKVEIKDVSVFVDEKDRQVVQLKCEIIEGVYAHNYFMKPYYVISDKILKYLKDDMLKFHVEFTNSSELLSQKKDIIGKWIRIQKEENKGYISFTLLEVVADYSLQRTIEEDINSMLKKDKDNREIKKNNFRF